MQRTRHTTTLLALIFALAAAGCGEPADPDDPIGDPIELGQCDLRLTKTVDGDTSIGGTATYTLTVDNVGDADCAPPITLTDDLPPGIQYQQSSPSSWSCQSTASGPDTVECTFNNPLPAQTSTQLKLEVTIGDAACMSSNCAAVTNGKRTDKPTKNPRWDKTPDNNRDCEESECKMAGRCVDPPSGMVGWWTGDQTTDDRSVETNHATLQQQAHYATGQVLESFEFDGDDDYAEVADDPSLDFDAGQDFSVDAWVYPSTDSDVGYLMDKRQQDPATGGITGWGLYWKGGQLNVFLQTNGANSNGPSIAHSSAGSAVPAGQWTHVTLTVDRANDNATLYIDGAVDGTFQPSATAPGTLANNAPLYFGRDHSNYDAYYFDGRLDEIEIFDRLLQPAEVQSLVDAGPCGKCRVACEEKTETFLGGTKDNYGGGDDTATPSTHLQQNFGPLKAFDDTTNNRHVAHTFTGLTPTLAQQNICRASLTIKMKPSTNSLADNDGLKLSFSDTTGAQIGPDWSSRIGAPTGLLPTVWDDNNGPFQPITLNLANLPGGTNLLAALQQYGMLDVRIQDDTTVDWMELKVHYCCEDEDATEREPDMAIEKSLEGELTIGQVNTYVISTENVGNGEAAPPVEITDTVPKCMKIAGIQAPWDQFCTVSGQQVSCSYPDPVPPGASLPDLLLDVVPSADCADKVENCATVANEGDANADNDKSCDQSPVTRPKSADLSIRKSLKGQALTFGGQSTYTLSVFNNGPGDFAGPVTVTDMLPTCLSYVSASPSSWSCNASGGTVTCTHPGPIASGSSLDLMMTVQSDDRCGDRVTNCASVDATDDPDISNNKSCIDSPVKR